MIAASIFPFMYRTLLHTTESTQTYMSFKNKITISSEKKNN
jgi:hypothetical protein